MNEPSRNDSPRFLERPDGVRLAWRLRAGRGPTVVFLGGFRSDMTGTKAEALDRHCAATGRAFLRLDYSGHGASGGAFVDGTIGRWLDDTLAVIDAAAPDGPLVLVGSSMGGWLAALAVRERPGRVAGLVTVAAAPDFTERLIRPSLDAAAQAALARDGVWLEPPPPGAGPDHDPHPITARLLADGADHLVLAAGVPLAGPAVLIHGLADAEVPWSLSVELAQCLATPDVEVVLVKEGDHRLSGPADLARLAAAVERVCAAVPA